MCEFDENQIMFAVISSSKMTSDEVTPHSHPGEGSCCLPYEGRRDSRPRPKALLLMPARKQSLFAATCAVITAQ